MCLEVVVLTVGSRSSSGRALKVIGQRQRMSDGRTCWADVAEPPAGDERLNAAAVVQQLGIVVCSSPTGTLEPTRGDIDVSVDKVCNWLAQECQASVG